MGVCQRCDIGLLTSRKAHGQCVYRALNARVRLECLNQHGFLSLDDARVKIDRWREMYNHERPHSQLEYKTPMEFAEAHRKEVEKQANLSQNFA